MNNAAVTPARLNASTKHKYVINLNSERLFLIN